MSILTEEKAMDAVHYFFDEAGDKVFANDKFEKSDIGLICGVALPTRVVPQMESEIARILSNLDTSKAGKIHATELFGSPKNREVRDELFSYLAQRDEWVLIYEAVYPLGVVNSNSGVAKLRSEHSPENPRVKTSNNPQRTRIYTLLLESVILKLDELCRIEGSTDVTMLSDRIDTSILKEALGSLDYLKQVVHESRVSGYDTVDNKVVYGTIKMKVDNFDIAVHHVNRIMVDMSSSVLILVADIAANALYRHLTQKASTIQNLRLHSAAAIDGFPLAGKSVFQNDDDIMDTLYVP